MSIATPESQDATEPGTVLGESVGYVLEVLNEGTWKSFTALKSDPDDVLRTYDFSLRRDPDEQVRIAEVRTTITQLSREQLEARTTPETKD